MKGIYLVGGYPDAQTYRRSFDAVARNGFDFIEVGIPFNDPLADGPVIAKAQTDAIAAGATVDAVMDGIMAAAGSGLRTYVMTYGNIIYSYGIQKFSDRMRSYLDGVIVADVPNRMAGIFEEQGFRIPVVPFATLETRESDIELMNRSASEIIYFVGVRGITGAQAELGSGEMLEKLAMLRKRTDKKIIIGFGIKSHADAQKALSLAHGYVVGTEAVRRQHDPAGLEGYLKELVGG